MRPLLSSVQGWRETAFTGWFGPIGIAAVFYAMDLQNEPAIEHPDRIWHIVSLVVFCSIVLHGISATPLTRAFGRSGAARPDEAAEGAVGIGWDAAGRRAANARKSAAGPSAAGENGGPDAGDPDEGRRGRAERAD